MKQIKLILLTMTLVGGLLSIQAQKTVVKVYPKRGKVVSVIKKPKVFVHKKTNFYFADGIWYKAKGKKYVVVGAPVGVKVRHLPRGNKIVHINGRKLYKYKGVWYKKSGRHYVVVNV